jgi:hypothetical protein
MSGDRRSAAREEGLTVQDINLYQPKSKGVRGALSAGSTATTFVVVAAALLGLWGFAWWQVKSLGDAVVVVRNQQAAQAAMSAAQGPQLDNLTDEELAALVAQLSASIENKNRALTLLANEGGAAAGFSHRLRAFGARHIDGIWLDRLTLGSTVQSVSVSGSTLSPDNVPRYLRSLAQDPALKGGQIDDFVIEKPDERQNAGGGRLTFRAGRRGLVVPEPAAEES